MSKLPIHMAIIMDGNGRWAKGQGLKHIDGHRQGVKTALDIVRYCGELGIRYLTLYTWSSENWRRPESEVMELMQLMHQYLMQESDALIENGVALGTIGATERLPLEVQSALQEISEKTAGGTRMQVTLALSYGSRDEIARAARKISEDVLQGKLHSAQIDENLFGQYLDTRGMPDPDLFIRTSGEMRLSNFLLWQMSYTELYVTKKTWPEFKRADLDAALLDFAQRQRRFGMTSEQVLETSEY